MRPLVLALDSDQATLELTGGKGASLARMAAAGLPVPPGFHITTHAYERFVAENALESALRGTVRPASAGDYASFDRDSAAILAAARMGALAAARMPEDVAQAIRSAYAELSTQGEAVAVRSSATAEDLPEMSFAGQHETFLNIVGEAELMAAVQRCWGSLWTPRAVAYRARNEIPAEQVRMAVVVQRLVPADVAGILFTANPVTGERDEVMINAAWGLGEAIVGGLVTPDTIVAQKASGEIVSRQIADKATMTVRTPGGTVEAPVPDDLRKQPALDLEQTARLVRLGARIEELYGRPVDVEWAIHDGEIFVLQARPVTALPAPASAASLEWRVLRPGGRYMRGSITELLPDPLTPLFASLGLPRWNEAMVEFGYEIGLGEAMRSFQLVTINDYAYYDFGIDARQTFQLVTGLGGMIARFGPTFLQGERRWAEEARPAYAAIVDRWKAAPVGEAPATELLEGVKTITLAAGRHYLSVQSGILPLAYMTESIFTAFYNRFVRRAGDPPAPTYLLGFDSAPIRAEKSLYDLARWVRTQEPLRAHIVRTPSSELVDRYRTGAQVDEVGDAWGEFRDRFGAHLERFGHAIYDLDFSKPIPYDEPAPWIEALKFAVGDEAPDPYERQSKAAAAREAATRDVLGRLKGRRLALFRRLLGNAQRFAPLREDVLADIGLGWPVLRRMLHELGRRLVQAGTLNGIEDVFYLQADELETAAQALDAGQSVREYQEQVAGRRARWMEERAVTPPLGLPPKEGTRFLGFDFSRFASARDEQPEGNTILGTGTSPGRVTGRARVILGPEEFGQMVHGDILVARITTPAWTPLFVLASGVVTDIGGPLSHGSIVAREYHIPAVLGTGVATERIHSGERVAVDGDAGTVALIDRSTAAQPATLAEIPPAAPRKRLLAVMAGTGLLGAGLLALAWLRRSRRRASRS